MPLKKLTDLLILALPAITEPEQEANPAAATDGGWVRAEILHAISRTTLKRVEHLKLVQIRGYVITDYVVVSVF